MLDKEAKRKIGEIIDKKDPAVIITHINPDGDAIGSSIALGLFLKKQGVPVSVIIPNEVPDFLKWMPGFDLVNVFTENKSGCLEYLDKASSIFFVDFNDPDRIGKLKKSVLKSTAFKILLDHHQNPVQFTDILITETWRGSAGEMIFLLMEELDGLELLDKDIATCLYVAIMTDTGNFRYGSSYAQIFNIVGQLVETGIDKNQIYSDVYDSYSESRMKLMGYCMSQKLVVLKKYNAAYISLTLEELERYDHQVGDTEGFVNIPFSIKGIKLTALFIEKKNQVKISFRSKGDFSVDALASKYFNGGGHINAAGGESALSLDDTLSLFINKLEEYKHDLA